MTLEDIYYIGQTIAAVAIVLSLVAVFFQVRYAAEQTRLNTAATKATAALDASRQFAALVGRYTGDPNSQRIWDEVLLNGSLSVEDRRLPSSRSSDL